jgi:pyruvate-formate lyase-activating enzyme
LHHEYLLELFDLCRKARLTSQVSTNGYILPWLSEALSKAVDLPAIGFKASGSSAFYRKMDADPKVVLESARIFYANNRRTDVTNLVGPTLEISVQDHANFATQLCNDLAPDVPVELKYTLNPGSPFWCTDEFGRTHEQAFYEAASKYLREVATVLAENGLTNVFWPDPLDIRNGKLRWARL